MSLKVSQVKVSSFLNYWNVLHFVPRRYRLPLLFVYFLIICGLSICLVLLLPIDTEYKSGIVSEIVGGGIFGIIVSGGMYFIDEKRKSSVAMSDSWEFFKNKLLPDIENAAGRGPTPWNLDASTEFYFDNSSINPLFDVYKVNEMSIEDCTKNLPSLGLIRDYHRFYMLARQGYNIGEKLDTQIRVNVRAENHRNGILVADDVKYVKYIRCKLFTTLTDKQLLPMIGWRSVPPKAVGITSKVSKVEDVQKLVAALNQIRVQIEKSAESIVEMASWRLKVTLENGTGRF